MLKKWVETQKKEFAIELETFTTITTGRTHSNKRDVGSFANSSHAV